MSIRVTFIFGCTGCGKGALGRALAERLRAEIVSVDSMKIYRRMDIGTAKPSPTMQAQIPHHLIDVADPCEEFSVARFIEPAGQAIQAIHQRGRPILAVGGTALYIKALSEGLFEGPSADEAVRARLKARAAEIGSDGLHAELQQVDAPAAEKIHPNDLRRIVRALEVYELTGTPISTLQTQWDSQQTVYDCNFVGLRRELEDQNRRTNLRVKHMLEAGLVDEVRALLAQDAPLSHTAAKAVGYAEIIEHLSGKAPLAEAVEKIKINTRQLAKAQRTWFKRFRQVHWIDLQPGLTAEDVADTLIKERGRQWFESPS
ncbi:MAG: tRNA (adenosine(37)-N6)-dimethylallyltransferase MiaA [Phycisphaerae bacterium]|nr:tRNA (adenosine(37)-N6)-dimethylallyltransferase MiaA [Phycisphaerae bacterium]